MASTRKTTVLLVAGLIVTAVFCNAQEAVQTEKPKPSVMLLPTTLPQPAGDPLLETVDKRPTRQVTETPWFWRFMEGMAIGAATYNTQKQSDGRPQTPSTVKP
ncbi:MAG: hypothetical protein OEL57_03105 [Trichlorobacter sp.]|uniref:hypothetical protein n=1 Tax=Trichlorobacter sp. TaxID=2911007 RepID=UPI00256C36A7|nr:hypothetical protein [Trichlorobacter sp.]MDK9716879.1 hypothetical protein [Trichlorobacter sp.]